MRKKSPNERFVHSGFNHINPILFDSIARTAITINHTKKNLRTYAYVVPREFWLIILHINAVITIDIMNIIMPIISFSFL